MPDIQSERVLADLRWTVLSPPLLADSEPAPAEMRQVSLQHLEDFLQGRRLQRVGVYFETLVEYWLRSVRQLPEVQRGIKIRDERRTLGELDFLIRNQNGQRLHLETAVKFYLYDPNSLTECQYIGPNPADTLHQKVTRLRQHQLPMSKQHFPDVVARSMFVKGRIFYHPDESTPAAHPDLAPDHLRGTWIREHQLAYLRQRSEGPFRVLQKPHWLAEETTDTGQEGLLDLADLTAVASRRFRGSRKPLLVSVLSPKPDEPDQFRETERVFIVSRRWPRYR